MIKIGFWIGLGIGLVAGIVLGVIAIIVGSAIYYAIKDKNFIYEYSEE